MNIIKALRFLFIHIIGGGLVLLGMIFIIVPGPSLLLLIPGLFILSYEYDIARHWLKKCQKMLSVSSRWLDRKVRSFKA